MEAINPWTRIPERASFDELCDDSHEGGYNQPQPQPTTVAPEPELAPAVSAQFAPPPPPAVGSGLWAGEPPGSYIPAECLAPGDDPNDELPPA